MAFILKYGIQFGPCDGSEMLDWDVDLTPEEEAIYRKALMTGADMESIPELEAIIEELRPVIEEEEIETMLENEDEYVLECTGEGPMDPDELNDLVHDRDPHALSFFGLTDADDEEIEDWDAYDLDERPRIRDFKEDFEEVSPFDAGWRLVLYFDNTPPAYGEVLAYLKELFEKGDAETARAVVKAQGGARQGDLRKAAAEMAKKAGCAGFESESAE